MKTNQLMKREFFDATIRQRTKDSYFNATDLLSFYNNSKNTNKRFKDFWDNKQTNEFAKELSRELNGDNSAHYGTCLPKDLYTTTRGKGGATYMHPYLFVKFAMWLSPEFEVKVIKWVYDNLIDFRNQAGDHYREMCKAISDGYQNYYDNTPSPLIYTQEARFLNELVKGYHESGKRNELNENELSLLNNLQKINISLISRQTPKSKRHEILRDYAENFKIANYKN